MLIFLFQFRRLRELRDRYLMKAQIYHQLGGCHRTLLFGIQRVPVLTVQVEADRIRHAQLYVLYRILA